VTDGAIVVDQLTKRYAGRPVVDRLSFVVRPGEVVGLLGPNGAGKTTTVEIVEGYRRPDGGTVRLLGAEPTSGGPELKARVGLMLQGGGGIYPQASPREAVRLFASFHRGASDAEELMDVVGLRSVADARYRRLSGGEKQRLALAIALVGEPEVLILDEPTAGLDPAVRATTRGLIADLRRKGTAILLTTHELEDVERVADRVILIDRGRSVYEGSPSALAAGGPPRVRFRLADPLSASDRLSLAVIMLDGARGDLADEGGARYRLDGAAASPALVERLAHWCAERGALLLDLRTGGGSLEERYLELVGSEDGSAGASEEGPQA
jgi:ABC-2 type transport system ATP-binding protein